MVKPDERKLCAAGKAAADPQADQRGRLRDRRAFVRFYSVCPFGRALGFGARERSERVTARRQPHRQRSRRLVYKPSARLTAIYKNSHVLEDL